MLAPDASELAAACSALEGSLTVQLIDMKIEAHESRRDRFMALMDAAMREILAAGGPWEAMWLLNQKEQELRKGFTSLNGIPAATDGLRRRPYANSYLRKSRPIRNRSWYSHFEMKVVTEILRGLSSGRLQTTPQIARAFVDRGFLAAEVDKTTAHQKNSGKRLCSQYVLAPIRALRAFSDIRTIWALDRAGFGYPGAVEKVIKHCRYNFPYRQPFLDYVARCAAVGMALPIPSQLERTAPRGSRLVPASRKLELLVAARHARQEAGEPMTAAERRRLSDCASRLRKCAHLIDLMVAAARAGLDDHPTTIPGELPDGRSDSQESFPPVVREQDLGADELRP